VVEEPIQKEIKSQVKSKSKESESQPKKEVKINQKVIKKVATKTEDKKPAEKKQIVEDSTTRKRVTTKVNTNAEPQDLAGILKQLVTLIQNDAKAAAVVGSALKGVVATEPATPVTPSPSEARIYLVDLTK
jgi:hypothetical protein